MITTELTTIDLIKTLLLAIIGSSGVSTVIVAILNRKWKKEDEKNAKNTKEDERIKALVEANKLLMLKELKNSAKEFIAKGCITLEEKEYFMEEEYRVYKNLGGNGHADLLVAEVNKLSVVSEDCYEET